jgi:hypothetical protein
LVFSSCSGEAVARKRTVVAVLRLVVEGSDLTHGEVVNTSGQVVGRFRAWAGLVPALQGWIKQQSKEEGTEDGGTTAPQRGGENRP